MIRCAMLTKKKVPCPIHADRCVDGVFYCHVHDPTGTFQQQITHNRPIRKSRKAIFRSPEYQADLAELNKKHGLPPRP